MEVTAPYVTCEGIEDLVVNSVALAFILQIDELMCHEFLGDRYSRPWLVGAVPWIGVLDGG